MKRTWTDGGRKRDWINARQAEGPEFLRHAVQVKNIWVPYGEAELAYEGAGCITTVRLRRRP